ncbi:MAG: exodeoxyribonuclease VII small subunit [Deltaproteobacteria bacterium]|nr:exodeoxyribonuclease VII small subunit [Deltaproteobacteria bacterium]MBW2308160.1 exodeoxyribonuclease VII small subunit [Deltaproteobacteria bacterium]
MKKNHESFEEALEKLEAIVHQMDRGELTLDESLKAFEEGVRLSRLCISMLDEAEAKVEALMKDPQGQLRTEPYRPEE